MLTGCSPCLPMTTPWRGEFGAPFMALARRMIWLGAIALTVHAAPALADVKAGVDAWSTGDFTRAVKEWQAAADRGDPDAQFNLGQVHRLGRGVPVDMGKARYYFAQAAAQGHMQAADNYGLMLFQDGKRTTALPYIEAASERGDPRAQYLMAIAYFNGDLVAKDWPRAYALISLANTAGLPQAAAALAQMDQYIPIEQRQQAAALATQIQLRADETRARQLASADLKSATAASSAARVPKPIERAPVAASAASPAGSLLQSPRMTGSDSAATAGADYSLAAAQVDAPVAKPSATRVPAAKPTQSQPAKPAEPSGNWRIQLGAFSVRSNAERLWTQLVGKGPLAGKSGILEPSGKLTKLYAGGFASSIDATAACAALKQNGQSCLVAR